MPESAHSPLRSADSTDPRSARRAQLERRRRMLSAGADYGVGILAPVTAAVATILVRGYIGLPLPFLLYFPAVIAAAWYRGFRSGLAACTLAVVLALISSPPVWHATPGQFVPTFFAFSLFGVSLLFIATICGQLQATRRSLENEKERYRTTVGSVADAVIATDLEGCIRTMNAQAERLTGWQLHEARGRPLFSVARLIDEESRRPVPDPVRAVVRARRPVSFGNHTMLLARDGREMFVEDSAAPIFDPTQEARIEGVVVVVRDVTESRRAAQELAENARQFESRVTERTRELKAALSDMETFSYAVSHDLRAPLRAIRMYADVLREDYSHCLDATAKEYLARIQRSSGRLDRITHDLLDYARIPAREVEIGPVDLGRLVREEVSALRQASSAERLIHVDEPLPWVKAHTAVLQQALRNLLENAGKFVVPGRTSQIHVFATSRGEWVRLNVRDNGVGIAPEDRGRIFRLFERLQAGSYPGTGIGLAVAKRAVEKCGGTLGFESTAGVGSTFWVELPRWEPEVLCEPRRRAMQAGEQDGAEEGSEPVQHDRQGLYADTMHYAEGMSA